MTRRKFVRLTLGIVLALFFIGLIARQVDLDGLRQAFVGTNPGWLVAGLLSFCAGYACRIERWRLMLMRDNPAIRWHCCAGPLLGSFAANNVLPFRAGDVLRIFAFNRRLGVTSGVVVATLFVERLLDLLMVLFFFGMMLLVFGSDVSRVMSIGSVALMFIAAAILLVLLLPQVIAPVAMACGRLIARIAPRLGQKLLAEIEKCFSTLLHLAKGARMLKLLAWSFAAWLAEGGVFWCAALALPSLAAPFAAWLALPVGTLATLVPGTPGYVGTFDYFTIRAMTALGNSAEAATAYALLVHALLWLPPTLAGGAYLLLKPIRETDKPEILPS